MTAISTAPHATVGSIPVDPASAAVTLLRSARERVAHLYGPCASSSPAVVGAVASREAERADWSDDLRASVLAAIDSLTAGG